MLARLSVTTLALLAFCPFALAKAPADISDLVGARAAGAEAEMQARGYEDVGGNNTWWNSATGTCAKVHVSQGHYSRIDTLAPSACGQHGQAKGQGHSGQNQSNSSASASGDVPQAALDACSKRADEFQNAAAGTSVVQAAARSGANWELKMATGSQYKSTCTVTGSGRVLDIEPGF